jgi:DamX protein
MEDNELLSAANNHSSFDNEGLEILPLITKERTQRFELLLHLIPNLKQHIILLGQSGIGKTLLLDMLYDIDSEAWQCCFVQGSAELSFENVEAQLVKTMRRNRHESLDSALNTFREQHKRIVLIIDDAGLLVSGLMTTLIEYAASQSPIKLIFSLTPDARNNHRKTDKALDDCYVLELPTLNKRQSASFLRQLAAKPRTYNSVPLDEKLLDKIYLGTNGVPAKILAEFTKLSRKNENNTTKWALSFVGVVLLAVLINQGARYFKEDYAAEEIAISPIEKVEQIEKAPMVQATLPSESQAKPEQDIVIPEFKLDIEKKLTEMPVTSQLETVAAPVEKTSDSAVESEKIEPEKTIEPTPVASETEIKTEAPTPPVEAMPEPKKTIEPAPVAPETEIKTETPAPPVEATPEPEKKVEPVITFPKIAPAKGMKIEPLPEKTKIQAVPISMLSMPDVKKVKIEPVKKVEIKPIEKPAVVKKPVVEKVESVKIEPIKKGEPKSTTPVVTAEKTDTKIEPIVPTQSKRYALQLITLSSEAAAQAFQKKHAGFAKNMHIVKSGTPEKPRFGVIYGGFATSDDATKAREKLPVDFADAVPRKMNP